MDRETDRVGKRLSPGKRYNIIIPRSRVLNHVSGTTSHFHSAEPFFSLVRNDGKYFLGGRPLQYIMRAVCTLLASLRRLFRPQIRITKASLADQTTMAESVRYEHYEHIVYHQLDAFNDILV